MKYTIIILSLLIGFNVNAETGLYVEIGISVHDVSSAKPEINLPNSLGNFGLGYTYKTDTKEYIELYFKHTSSILYTEKGYGLNQLGLQYKKYF